MVARARLHPRRQPMQARAQATVESILRATERVLVKEGYDGANTNRIAEVAGVSVGSLYQYFPSKEALVMALVDEHCDQMLGLMAQHVSESQDASLEVATRAFVRAMLHAHALQPELHRVMVEQLPRIQGFDKVRQMSAMAQALVMEFLQRHRARLRPANLELASFLVVYAVEAATHAAILEKPHALQDGELAEEISQLVLRYLLAGDVAPPESVQ
ncbi:MAG: TetR/AcrR family transcriptional regulator [Myxococcota bacterium]